MAEEKQTDIEEINDSLNRDDIEALREVLRSEHARGIAPVSVYRQADFEAEE